MRQINLPLALVVVGSLMGIANAHGGEEEIHACVQKPSGLVRIVEQGDECLPTEHALSWNVAGPQGPQGEPGPPGPQGPTGPAAAREAHVVILGALSGVGCTNRTEWAALPTYVCPPAQVSEIGATEVDGTRYPAGSVFKLTYGLQVRPNSTYCTRLFDIVANAPVSGTEVCRSNSSTTAADTVPVAVDSLSLTDSFHKYVVQAKDVAGEGGLTLTARMVIRWA